MALTENHPLTEYIVPAFMADISTAGSAFAISPIRGRLIRTFFVNYAATSVAADVVTMEIDNVAVPGVSISTGIAPAAGTVHSGAPTAYTPVPEGGRIEWITSGASTGASAGMFYAVIGAA